MPTVIGSTEAQTHFARLLKRVEHGEEVVITRRGKPIAPLIPAQVGHDVAASRQAADRLAALAQQLRLGPFDWDEWKSYRDTGRI